MDEPRTPLEIEYQDNEARRKRDTGPEHHCRRCGQHYTDAAIYNCESDGANERYYEHDFTEGPRP